MSQALNLKLKGLYTHPNDLSEIPEGALAVADNVVFDKESIAEPRRGFSRLEHAFSDQSYRANKLFQYQDKLIAHYSTDKLAYYDDATGWQTYSGSFGHPDANLARIRSADAGSNLYFTTSTGIKVLDVYNGTPSSAGIPRGLDCQATTTGSSGFMTDDSQVAYRIVWGYRDANNNLIIGAPSQRGIATNSTGGTRDVSLQITIPAGITTDHFYQVYRSPMSADASTEPSDELGLVYEANPTAGEITAKTLTITDQTPEDLRGATLYTSPSQQGIAQANDEPPLAHDLVEWKGCLWALNTTSKHRAYLTILAVGGTGLVSGDVLTIAGTTYTGAASENVGTRSFAVVTSGTPSQNIADTALSLVRVINQNATNTSVYAYYLSGEGDLPGQLMIEERSLGGAAFSIIASAHGTAYNPQLPTSGTTVSSSNDRFLNGLFNSKLQEFEAFPLLNYRKLGSASKKGLRVIPLRDSLFILKEDGIWRGTGEYPSFSFDPLDLTTKLIAPETAVVLNNQIYALTDQGVVSISDTGIQVVSRPIEISLLEIFGANLETLKNASFGVSYETERKYILFVPTTDADTYPTQAYVFNTFTSTWSRWDLAKKCGLVKTSNDLLYLGDAESHYTNEERKSYSFRDYVDEALEVSITAITDDQVTLLDVSEVAVGDVLYQSSSLYTQILAVDVLTKTVTVNVATAFALGTTTLLKGYECAVEWAPQTGGNPGLLKHFQEATLLFRNNYFPTAKIGFYSELSGSLEETDVSGVYGGLWGLFPWGGTAWGGVQRPRNIRTLIPREKAWCSALSVRFAMRMGYATFLLQGLSIPFENISEKVTK
ncbi:hypothetical protein UFOVP1351_21 [uncultured Caudovirales phage]|uniref:Uncharacterized protein n=1 Tax=uncultured Caudovirales phage TaxID=2100421 RepID=A0A6J5RZN4_9CAUD|nr:hypothetical protein UFOVP1351_21 [uncultured Caudovirales phage]